MTTTNEAQAQAPQPVGSLVRLGPLKKLGIWGLFLFVLYLARDFFFVAFMTFLFSYLTLAVVGWAMKRLSPGRERAWLRRLLTVGVFLVVPLTLLGLGALVAPRLLAQAQRLGGWLSQTSPEGEVSRLLENFVGPYQFKQHYGGPNDPRYQKGLEEFRATGERHVAAYNDFPNLEAWVEAGFASQFAEAQRGRIRTRLLHEGTSSKEFADWFLTQKVPELQEQAKKQIPRKGRPAESVSPLVRAASSAKPEQLLAQARHDPALLAELRQQWLHDALEQGLAAAKRSPAYHEQFRTAYEKEQEKSPGRLPYSFAEYIELQRVRPQGRRAFGDALEKMRPASAEESTARLQADFEAAKKHDLFHEWWGTSSVARFIRQHVETGVSGSDGRMERILASLLDIPIDLGTALLLSFFICLDFPNLKRGFGRLRETWLRDVYDELAPALSDLGQLIGRSLHAQGLIALCNATMVFVALTWLGVEHEVLLSVAVFILCLVPTLGAVISLFLIAGFALLQFGGGMPLALKAAGAVVIVLFVESFVLSPRILGRMLELHPVLLIALLPVAQYFFGVWGLILAAPVAVYVIHVLILGRGLPGTAAAGERPAEPGASAGPEAGGQAEVVAVDRQRQTAPSAAK
jgi:predicted PurR-regulated permease PerM